MDAEPALPSMRKRMLRRKELLSKLTDYKPAPVSPPASPSYSAADSISNSIEPAQAVDTITAPTRRASVETLAPSSVTSLCSAPSLRTDYGLHRALISLVVPNEADPIATVKDRKNANYLDNVNTTHDMLRTKLDDAITEYNRILDFRTGNRDPKIQDLLNRCFLDANNKLTKCSREYAAFCEDLHELRNMPKLSREEMEKRFTNLKIKAKLDRAEDGAGMKQHMRKIENQIVDLEIERDDLIKRTGAVAALSEQVCFVEHLNDSLVAERSTMVSRHAQVRRELEQLRRRIRQLEQKDGQNFDALDQLTEDCAYLSHLNNVLTRDLGASKTENLDLRNQLEASRTLREQLNQAQTDIRNLHSQLSYAKATAGTLKNENKDLHREIEDLRYALKGTKTELQELREINDRLHESSSTVRTSLSYLRDEFKDVEAQAEQYRSEVRKHVAEAAELRVSIARLEAEIAGLRAGATAAAVGNELVEFSGAKRTSSD